MRIGGGFIKGIFGGERKRISIGYEIFVDFFFFLFDELILGFDLFFVRKE